MIMSFELHKYVKYTIDFFEKNFEKIYIPYRLHIILDISAKRNSTLAIFFKQITIQFGF